jgi:hypothetical protein
MTRSRSRKLLSRILWFDPDAGSAPDTVPETAESAADTVPDIPTYQDRSLVSTPPPSFVESPRPAVTRVRSRLLPNEPPVVSTPDLYTEHFGLKVRPFALTPDPDFLFWPPSGRVSEVVEIGWRRNLRVN